MANDRVYQAGVIGVVKPTDEKARIYQAGVVGVVSPTDQKARIYQAGVIAVYPSSNPTGGGERTYVVWVG